MKITFVFYVVILTTIVFFQANCLSNANTSAGNVLNASVSPTIDRGINNSLANIEPENGPTVREWTGKVGNNELTWNGNDLTLKKDNGKVVKIFSELAVLSYKQQVKTEPDTKECLSTYHYRPIAIAHNIISYESEEGMLCGAINTASWGYSTLIITDSGEFLQSNRNSKQEQISQEPDDVSIYGMFSDKDILAGLLANERVSSDIARLVKMGRITKEPKNLSELQELFKSFPFDFLDGRFYLDSDWLEAFAIHHLVDDDRVSVWLSLLPKAHAEQAVRDHLEIVLPIPEKYREFLRLANSEEAGFLLKDADKYAGNKFAKFEFGGGKR